MNPLHININNMSVNIYIYIYLFHNKKIIKIDIFVLQFYELP